MNIDSSERKDLHALLDNLVSLHIVVAGDLILDRYIWGKASRISDEAPVPIVNVSHTESRLGGAGNVVKNLRNLGIKVSVCGYIGNDDEGNEILNLLEKDGAESEGVFIARERPTVVKTRVIARAQQVVRIDREETNPLPISLQEAFAAAVEAQAEKSNAIIVSDYAKGAISKTTMDRLGKSLVDHKLGLEAKRPLVVDPHPRHTWMYNNISFAKPNRSEAESITGVTIESAEDGLRAAKKLKELWNAEMMLVSLGDLGLVILPPGDSKGIIRATEAREVFDVSGAGDCVTAVFTAAIAAGASYSLAGDLANIAAGVVVSEVGTVPITLAGLRDAIDRFQLVPGGGNE